MDSNSHAAVGGIHISPRVWSASSTGCGSGSSTAGPESNGRSPSEGLTSGGTWRWLRAINLARSAHAATLSNRELGGSRHVLDAGVLEAEGTGTATGDHERR